jgi:hypothetical protein
MRGSFNPPAGVFPPARGSRLPAGSFKWT